MTTTNETDVRPVRIQRSRKKGSRLTSPNGLPVVCVTRPGRFGNPYGTAEAFAAAVESGDWYDYLSTHYLHNGNVPDCWGEHVVRKLLRGRNLACWCPLPKAGEPDRCHAAVLLKLVNG